MLYEKGRPSAECIAETMSCDLCDVPYISLSPPHPYMEPPNCVLKQQFLVEPTGRCILDITSVARASVSVANRVDEKREPTVPAIFDVYRSTLLFSLLSACGEKVAISSLFRGQTGRVWTKGKALDVEFENTATDTRGVPLPVRVSASLVKMCAVNKAHPDPGLRQTMVT